MSSLSHPGTVQVGVAVATEHCSLPWGQCGRAVGWVSSSGIRARSFGDGYMITVRTKSSLNVKEVVRFFNRNFPEAILKVSSLQPQWHCGGAIPCQPSPLPHL